MKKRNTNQSGRRKKARYSIEPQAVDKPLNYRNRGLSIVYFISLFE